MEKSQSVTERFSGFVDIYDKFRPETPGIIPELLIKYTAGETAAAVADLGCGTGLSTFVWIDFARMIVGIDLNEELLTLARSKQAYRKSYSRIEFVNCSAQHTGLPPESIDIATCSQAFHFMEPESTLTEIDRILKPGGVFCAYDYELPPVSQWELDFTFTQLLECIAKKRNDLQIGKPKQWRKSQHLENMRKSKRFRFIREVCLHTTREYDCEKLEGLLLSHGLSQSLIRHGFSKRELGIVEFCDFAEKKLKKQPAPMQLGYKLRIAVK